MRAVSGRFAIEKVETTYTIATASADGGVRAGDLIVSGPACLPLASPSVPGGTPTGRSLHGLPCTMNRQPPHI